MDIDPGSVLTNRGLNGYGFGMNGNFAGDGSAVKEGVRGNRDIQLLESVNGNARGAALANQLNQHNEASMHAMTTGHDFITDRIASLGMDSKFSVITSQFASVTAELASIERASIAAAASAERLAFSNQSATLAQLHSMDIKQTECCCELRAGQAAINAKLDSQAAVSAAVAAAKTEATLATLIAANARGRQGND